jgi:hypothetical protein
MFFLIFFFLLAGHQCDSNPDVQLISPGPELAWNRMYIRYRWLRRMDPTLFKSLIKKASPSFRWNVDDFRSQIRKFFSRNIIEGLSALEGDSNDTGLVFFFLGALVSAPFHDLKKYHDFYFSFDKTYHNKLNAWGSKIEGIIECAANYINWRKTVDVLRIALRIFEKLQKKIGNIVTVKPLTETIEFWRFEIIKLNMKLDEIGSIEESKPENGTLREDPALSPDVILLYKDLINCYQLLKSLCGLKKPSNVLKAHYCRMFGSLAFDLAIKSGDFSILLSQEFELIIILVDFFLVTGEKEAIQKNFEIFFQEPRDYSSQKNLAISLKGKLFEMSKADVIMKNCRFEVWVLFKGEITKNSSKDYIKLANKISLFNPKREWSNPTNNPI